MTLGVSVVLPVRNAARTLGRALRSTLRSRAVDLEVVVLLHACSDGSQAVAERWADGRVRLVELPDTATFSDVLNQGIALARAPLIARMDADDVMHPLRLASDVATLAEPSVDVCACSVKLLRAPGRDSTTAGLQRYVDWQNACRSADDHLREIWIEQPVCHPATTFRRAVVQAAGGYRHGAFPEDYDLFLRLLTSGARMVKRPERHHGWREHAGTAGRWPRDAFADLKVQALVERYGARTRALAVAGAGKEGGRIGRVLRAHGLPIHAYFDVDPKRVGTLRHGAPVHHARELVGRLGQLKDPLLLVAVGTSGARPVLRAQLQDAGLVEGRDAIVVA